MGWWGNWDVIRPLNCKGIADLFPDNAGIFPSACALVKIYSQNSRTQENDVTFSEGCGNGERRV